MIESSTWNSKKDETIYKAAGSIHLRKYGKFFEELSERTWKKDSTLEYFMEGPLRLIYKPVEDVSLIFLIEMENKFLLKLLAAVAGTCREIKLLEEEAKTFYKKLFTHGERDVENNQHNITSLLSDLQDLYVFVNRIWTVAHLTTEQLSSLANNSNEVYLSVLIEHFIDLFVIVLMLDEIIESQPSLLEQWKKYRIHVRSIMNNPLQFGIMESKLHTFDKLLKDLQEHLLKKVIFSRTIERIMDVNKGPIMNEHITNYLKNIMFDVENKSTNNAALNKNWIRVNIGIVLIIKLFGTCDKRLMKRVLENNKKFYAVTLIGSVIWVPSKFLSDFLPKEFGNNAVSPQVGEKILCLRIQKLSQTVNNLIHKAVTWCSEMPSILTKTHLQISDIRQKQCLFVDLVVLLSQIKETISFIMNMHATLIKPMNRNTVQLICRLMEVQKALQNTFYTLGPLIVQSQSQVLQYLSYNILVTLESARKCLIQKDKGYTKERLDTLSLIDLSMKILNGPASADRRLIIRCALACASQLTDTFKEEDILKLKFLLDNYDTIAELHSVITEVCDYSILLHHQNIIPAYFSSVTDSNMSINHIVHLFGAFNSTISEQEGLDLKEKRIVQLKEMLIKNILEPVCREIETDLRLHVHAHLKFDSTNPFNIGAKDGGRIVQSLPLPLANSMIYAKRFIEHYLDDMFYNLTTVELHDWRTYRMMHALAHYKLNLNTIQNHLPTQTLEQGLDALEIMRNIHVFVSKYLYNLNTQTFIEHVSNNKHLNTIGIRHIANSIRTHGTGIMSTTVNFVYQFLRVKLHTFSQFLFDEHIKSRLMRDIRFIKVQRENGSTPYTYERAEKFQKGIRKLGMTSNDLSYLDQFRQLVTQIGNALGYVRLIRSGGLHYNNSSCSKMFRRRYCKFGSKFYRGYTIF
ncbi:strumpellin and WASH-interacting protein isoform X2 [Ptiloglossa arizonensis]|uniref:strumpellin and WASH-interacting protein isoform X2 n=1 Tax=Ptiloglossa arizonensis TaxID=3350558 RepID=UPI003F9EF4FA